MKFRSKNHLPGSTKYFVKLALVIPVALMLLISGTTFAADQDRGEDGAIKTPPLPEVRVTIASKTAESVTTNIGDSFTVSRQTIIVGLDGHQVSIRKLLVPCDAVVTYSVGQDSNHPLAQMIRVNSVDSHATWKYEGGKD